jgi:hypothetical protein
VFSYEKDATGRGGQDLGWFRNFSFSPVPLCSNCTCSAYAPEGYAGPPCVSTASTCQPANCTWVVTSSIEGFPSQPGGEVSCLDGVHRGTWHSCPRPCAAPVVLGYTVACEESLVPGTSCEAVACAAGWQGSPTGSVRCLGHLAPADWESTLHGCSREPSTLLTARLVQDGWCREVSEGLVCENKGTDTLNKTAQGLKGTIPLQISNITDLKIM